MQYKMKPEVHIYPGYTHIFCGCKVLRVGLYNRDELIEKMKKCEWFDQRMCVDNADLQFDGDCTNPIAKDEIGLVDKMEEI